MADERRLFRLRLEEGGETFRLIPLGDHVNYYSRSDILLCRCHPPLVLPASYSQTEADEGSMLCAVADRYREGSLLGQGRLPAMVDVLVVRPHVLANAAALDEGDATFAFTGVLTAE